jgi:putative membrane protein
MGHMTNNWGMPWGGMHYGYGYGYGGLIMWIVIIILVALAVYFFVKIGKGSLGVGSQESPLDILKKRYAKGEISKDDFERMKKDIM